jgi:hypothetical protein
MHYMLNTNSCQLNIFKVNKILICDSKVKVKLFLCLNNMDEIDSGHPTSRNTQLSVRKKSGNGLQMGARYQDSLAKWPLVVT